MKVKTNVSILQDTPKGILYKISDTWNKISKGWKMIWGPHIHHGYYEHNEKIAPLTAQEKLIEKLAVHLNLQASQKVLDVGCGMGGSSLYLAKKYRVETHGITLSQKQLELAVDEAKKNPHLKVNFSIEDAHLLSSFDSDQFDVVWSLESCEQFYDKKLFIEQAYRVLKPGGKLLLATWCSDQEFYEARRAKHYLKICKAFDVPYMPTMSYYRDLLNEYFSIDYDADWSSYVKQSWDLGIAEIKKHSLLSLLKLGGLKGLQFVSKIALMRNAFKDGQLRYGVYIGIKQ